MSGHIKIDRRILQWEWYADYKVLHLFLYILLKANFKESKWKGIIVERGQMIFGRTKASTDTGLTENEIRTCLKKLKSTSEITVKSTNKYSIITICKYDTYQNNQEQDNQQYRQQDNQQLTSKAPAINQQLTTSKNDKKNNINYINTSGENFFSKEFACYNAEEYILQDQILFEKICIATKKAPEYVKKELHMYHLWMAKKEQYPVGKGAAAAGIESWILNAKDFRRNFSANEPKKNDTLPNGYDVAKNYS